MLALRRVSTLYQYIHPLSSYQYRYKSNKSSNDEAKSRTTSLSEDILDFERKDSNTPRNIIKNRKFTSNEEKIEKKQSISRESFTSNDDKHQTEDLLRNLNVSNINRRKKSLDERARSSSSSPSIDRFSLAKSFDLAKKKGEQVGQKPKKKSLPNVILDTESNEVKTLTRQVADSLTPANSPNDSTNIEQELLDVLRGHRVVSKTARRMEKKPEDSNQTKKRTSSTTANVNVEKTTEAFSSLLRDIKLSPTRDTSKSSMKEDFIRDAVDGSMVRSRFSDDREQRRDNNETRKPMRDTKRRQEFMRPHELWSGESLGIFTKKDVNDLSSKISPIWEKYEQDELTRISSIPPRNAFEEMIQWTKDGILWKFPVDNEQDIGPEADVPFYEHVLLERHLNDFPNTPLIRQFMELVCVGLGRNPYWTVEQKLEHINWFRNFFNEKMNVFNETVHTGAIKTSAPPTVAKPVSTYKPKPTPPPAAPKVVPVVAPPAVKTPTASKK